MIAITLFSLALFLLVGSTIASILRNRKTVLTMKAEGQDPWAATPLNAVRSISQALLMVSWFAAAATAHYIFG